jgi:ferrous iron transport protein A
MGEAKQLVTLAEMHTGESGTIVQIVGGHGLVRRLDAMGIRAGKKVTKISSVLFHGPVTLKVDSVHIAIGFGMAKRIIVEPDKYLPRGSSR